MEEFLYEWVYHPKDCEISADKGERNQYTEDSWFVGGKFYYNSDNTEQAGCI